MSGTINKAILIGHLGDAVKMHYFEEGKCIGRFPLATNETYTSRESGEKVSNTDWHNIVVRNKLAELCEKYVNKGDKVYVEGRIKNRQWEDKEGNTKYTTEIHVNDITFLGGKKNSEFSSGDNAENAIPENSVSEDDLPF